MIASLVKLDQATRMLAEIRTVDDAKQLMDLAEAARVYARQVDLGLEAQNHAAEIKLRAQRRAGEVLAEMEKAKGARGKIQEHLTGGSSLEPPEEEPPTYAEMDIRKSDAHNWQTIAGMPEEEFEAYIAETTEENKELTTAGIVRAARIQRTAELVIRPSMAVHYLSGTDEWNTPPEIIERIVRVLGKIDLDPCSNNHETPNVPATKHFTKEDDGLTQGWRGRIYMNPPYGREIAEWVNYLCGQFEIGNVTEAIALLPARTDTEWFRRLRQYPRCFIWGRLRFSGNEVGAPFPSMVVYLGDNVGKFIDIFREIGDNYVWLPTGNDWARKSIQLHRARKVDARSPNFARC